MPEKPSPELSPEEELRADNEIKALSLELTYGALTHISDDAPPEMIKEWLQNVADYEAQHKDVPPISVYDRIGRPVFATPDLLEAATLPGEIERLQEILEANGLVALRPDYVDDEQFYRFMVTELFAHEVPDLHLPGMMTVIDYAEFHPNHPDIIGAHASEFLLDLLQLEKPYEGLWLSENLRDYTATITKQAALRTIQQFRDRYQEIKPVGFAPQEVLNSEHGTHLMFSICWEGQPTDGSQREHHEGLGVIQMAYEHEQWLVQGVQMPGFQF